MKLFGSIRAAVSTAFRSRPTPDPLRLRRVPELELLHPTTSIAAALDQPAPGPGVFERLRHPISISEVDMAVRLKGRIGGEPRPHWADGTEGALRFGVCLCRVPDALYFPGFGAVATPEGEVLHSSVAEALYLTPDLGMLPGVSISGGMAALEVPEDVETIPAATVFAAWGGRFNYGHFLLDSLPALAVVAEQGLLERFPALMPRLDSIWQSDLLDLMLGEAESGRVRETSAEVVQIEDALFATPMDHFLHAPGWPLDRVRERILSRLPETTPGPERIYLSRRKDEKRPMLNEAELEAGLEALGFTMVFPQDLDVAAQIALFRDAKVVVGATGAAFANCLFCAPQAKVFEIQPANYTGIWTRNLCHFVGADWYAYFTASPAEDEEARAVCDAAPGAMFAWHTPVQDFLGFLNERI